MRLSITVIVLGFLCIASQQARPQIVTADLEADSIAYSFPTPDSIEIAVFFSFYNSFEHDSILSSDITILLDGVPVHWSPLDIDASEAVCLEDPDCNPEMCDAIVTPGKAEVINCKWVKYEGWPHDSIPHYDCVCWGKWSLWRRGLYSNETQISFILDSMDGVIEANEANNEMSLAIHPVPALRRSPLDCSSCC
jgi:hypothetical protein